MAVRTLEKKKPLLNTLYMVGCELQYDSEDKTENPKITNNSVKRKSIQHTTI